MKVALVLALGFGITGTVAQIAPGGPASNETIPEKDRSRPAEGGTQGDEPSSQRPSLSDRLGESGGVIKPPSNVDRSGDHAIASGSQSQYHTRYSASGNPRGTTWTGA